MASIARGAEFATPLRTLLFAGAILAPVACGSDQAAAPGGAVHRVLIVGNSLTQANDLPAVLTSLGAQAGTPIQAVAVVSGGFALIDHALGGSDAMQRIASGGWESVILQQGPTWPGVCGDTLTLAARMFDEQARAVGASTALLMTWPAAADSAAFDGVIDAYTHSALAIGGSVIPAGTAWRAAWHEDATLALYGSDDFHPSPLGTYLTALVLYEAITGGDARGLPPSARVGGVDLDVPEATIRLLQSAAHASVPRTSAPAGRVARAVTC